MPGGKQLAGWRENGQCRGRENGQCGGWRESGAGWRENGHSAGCRREGGPWWGVEGERGRTAAAEQGGGTRTAVQGGGRTAAANGGGERCRVEGERGRTPYSPEVVIVVGGGRHCGRCRVADGLTARPLALVAEWLSRQHKTSTSGLVIPSPARCYALPGR